MDTPDPESRPAERDLEPTIAVPIVTPPVEPPGRQSEHMTLPPTVTVTPPPVSLPDRPPAPSRLAYVYGNAFAYTLRRGFALAFDVIVPSLSMLGVMYGRISINPLTGFPINSQAAFDVTFEIALGITFLYIWLAQAIFGTTLGKLLFGLHLFTRRVRFIGLGRALVRNVLLPIDLLVIGIVLVLLPGHRRLGDLLGGTVVARSPLRAFAPLLGLGGFIVVAALPFIFAGGTVHVVATLAAFVTLGPHIFERIITVAQQIFETIRGMSGSH